MKKTRDRMLRGDEEFIKFLREVKLERIKKGMDNKMLSDRRLTLALARVPRLKDILSNSEIKEEDILK